MGGVGVECVRRGTGGALHEADGGPTAGGSVTILLLCCWVSDGPALVFGGCRVGWIRVGVAAADAWLDGLAFGSAAWRIYLLHHLYDLVNLTKLSIQANVGVVLRRRLLCRASDSLRSPSQKLQSVCGNLRRHVAGDTPAYGSDVSSSPECLLKNCPPRSPLLI
ncbi:hypothetical protein QQ045_005592 [Rhodiola kirilowii]